MSQTVRFSHFSRNNRIESRRSKYLNSGDMPKHSRVDTLWLSTVTVAKLCQKLVFRNVVASPLLSHHIEESK